MRASWRRAFTSGSLRRRLLVLLLVVFLPSLGIMVASWTRQRDEEIRQAEARALILVESLAAQQEQIVTATRMLLSTVAHAPEVQRQDAAACNRLFRELRARYPLYAVIGAVTADGTLFANSSPFTPGTINLADRRHVREAIRTREFSVGEYLVGRVNSAPAVYYALPVLDAAERVTAVVIAAVRLEQYVEFVSKLPRAPDDVMTILDGNGVRVYRVPGHENAAGVPLPPDAIARISGPTAQGVYHVVGHDGIPRIYGFRQMRLPVGLGRPYLYMIAGIAKGPVLARANRAILMNVVTLGIAACLALTLAWWVGQLSVVRPAARLVAAAARLAHGDLTTRTGVPHTADELGRLAAAFDEMAIQLEARRQERAHAEQALSAANAELEMRVRERTQALSAANVALTAENRERRQAEAALRARTAQLEAVREVSAELTRELDPARVLHLIVMHAVRLMSATSGTCFLWDEARRQLVPQAWIGYDDWRGATTLSLDEGLAGYVARCRQGVVTTDYPREPYADRRVLARKPIQAVMGEPLVYRERLTGVLTLDFAQRGEAFTPDERTLLCMFAAQAAIALENARLFADAARSYEQLQQTQAELVRTEKLRALGQMGAGIAHDLNNMLAAILGQAELLRLTVNTPEILAALGTLETAASDGAAVVRRLQDFGRQRGEVPLAPLGLAGVVSEALEMTRPRWRDEVQRQGRAVHVEMRELQALPPILGYAPELREALTNLILNAVDAMPQGGTLTFSGRERAGWVELDVTDTGIGMPEAVRERIFDPFFTTKGVQGTGLGLSVVYGILQRHGGRIDVTSAPGHGTTFSLWLRPAGAASPPAETPDPRPSPPQRRLLVIDDDPYVRETLVALLRGAGHSVIEADGGVAGLQRLAQDAVDLVMTDLGMPDLVGWDVARESKRLRPHVPVVVLTGWGEHVEPADGTETAGVDRILGKPVRLQELLRTIADLCPAAASRAGGHGPEEGCERLGAHGNGAG